MFRIVTCSLILAGVVYVIRIALNGAFNQFGFASGITICIVGTAIIIALGFAYDSIHRSRQ